jgi:HlyD family secretion protein
VELGTVISSPTRDVGGGTVLLKMANLDTVQIRTLVDETDIGKVQPGQRATVTVDAYPNRPFSGTVLKIEPQATTTQNVTTFPVVVRIANEEGLLRPGMNSEVEIHVGRRDSVLAVPNAALRTQRDVGSAAQVLGLSATAVQSALAGQRDSGAAGQRGSGAAGSPDSQAQSSSGYGAGGGSKSARRRSGGTTAPQPRGPAAQPRYIVFVKRNGQPTPVWIRTGLTDMDYSEVLQGLTQSDSVFVLPSASLVQSQQDMRDRINRVTGGGAVPGMQQQTTQPAGGAARPAGGARP